MKFFYQLILLIVLCTYISNCRSQQYHECELSNIDSLLFAYEKWLIYNQNGKLHVSLSTNENIQEIYIEYIGCIYIDGDTITLIKNEAVFGLPESPHGNGTITIYKNKCKLGKYIGFDYGFNVWINNNNLYFKSNFSKNEPRIDTVNIITFQKGLPAYFIVNSDAAGFGDYIYLDLYKSIVR